MNEREEITKEYLDALNAKSIDELNDEIIVGILSLTTDSIYGGATTIYDECNETERKQFIEDAKRVIKGDADMDFLLVNKEGVKTGSNEEYFEWISRHSVWYRITATH